MHVLVVSVHVIVSIVLIAVILFQAGRGSGVSELFGGSSNRTIFGTSATSFLMKATAVCAVLFILTSITLAVMTTARSKSLMPSRGIVGRDETQFPARGGAGMPAGETVEIPGVGADTSKAETKAVPAEGGASAAGEKAPVSGEETAPAKNEGKPVEP